MDVGYGGCETGLSAPVAFVFLDRARTRHFFGSRCDTGDNGGRENILDVAAVVFCGVVDMAGETVGVLVVFVAGDGRSSCFNVIVGMAMVAAVGVAVVVEEEETEDVGCQPCTADGKYKLGGADFLGLKEPLNGFEEDGKTKGEEEYTVDQSSKDFSPLPLQQSHK